MVCTPPPPNLTPQPGGSREHPLLQTGKGGPGSEPRPQLDGAQAGWWGGPHGALWSGSQLPGHLPWRRRGGRGLGANSTLSFQQWGPLGHGDADQRVRWSVSLNPVTRQTQPCRPRPQSFPVPQPTCTGPQAGEPVQGPHRSHAWTAPVSLQLHPSPHQKPTPDTRQRHPLRPTQPWASPCPAQPSVSPSVQRALGPTRQPSAPPPPASGGTGPKALFTNKPRACRGHACGPRPACAHGAPQGNSTGNSVHAGDAMGQPPAPLRMLPGSAWTPPTVAAGNEAVLPPLPHPASSQDDPVSRMPRVESPHRDQISHEIAPRALTVSPKTATPQDRPQETQVAQGWVKSMGNAPFAACPAEFSRKLC